MPMKRSHETEPMLRGCISCGNLKGMGMGSKRNVSFSKIEIREYERSTGDNVASNGVPLTLGWQYSSAGELDVDSYERYKPAPRTREEMKLPNHVRMDILKHAGYSLQDRMRATKESNIARNRRIATAAMTPEMAMAEYQLEKASRTVKRVVLGRKSSDGKSKKKEKEEIERLIRKDRLRSSWNQQLKTSCSCPHLHDQLALAAKAAESDYGVADAGADNASPYQCQDNTATTGGADLAVDLGDALEHMDESLCF